MHGKQKVLNQAGEYHAGGGIRYIRVAIPSAPLVVPLPPSLHRFPVQSQAS